VFYKVQLKLFLKPLRLKFKENHFLLN
jgi:hypothetical protein